jgi:hypothetical protein
MVYCPVNTVQYFNEFLSGCRPEPGGSERAVDVWEACHDGIPQQGGRHNKGKTELVQHTVDRRSSDR